MIAASPSTRAFCVGQAKSGTASLAGLLRRDYRTAHEPEREETLDLILSRSRGDSRDIDFGEVLVKRDRRLDLEYDIAWANQFIVEDLVTVFPKAKFIVLLRDCYTWLQSVTGHLISRDVPSDVIEFLDWWFRPDQFPNGPKDALLGEHGLYSITAYLMAWNRHIDTCMAAIPSDRCLVLRTHELSRSHAILADFLEVPVETLDTGKGHQNRSTWSHRLESFVDPVYLEECVRSVSGENMARHFPEVRGRADVPSLWSSA